MKKKSMLINFSKSDDKLFCQIKTIIQDEYGQNDLLYKQRHNDNSGSWTGSLKFIEPIIKVGDINDIGVVVKVKESDSFTETTTVRYKRTRFRIINNIILWFIKLKLKAGFYK